MQTPQDQQLLAEAMRRRYGGQPSSAGVQGGAPVANAVTPANPVAQEGMTQGQQQGAQGGASGFPSGDGVSQLKSQDKGEGTFIVKALADRLKKTRLCSSCLGGLCQSLVKKLKLQS